MSIATETATLGPANATEAPRVTASDIATMGPIDICIDALVQRIVLPRKANGRASGGSAQMQPDVQLYFRFADGAEVHLLRTSAWSFVSELAYIDADAKLAAGHTRAVLAVERVEYTAKNGLKKGQRISYDQLRIRFKK